VLVQLRLLLLPTQHYSIMAQTAALTHLPTVTFTRRLEQLFKHISQLHQPSPTFAVVEIEGPRILVRSSHCCSNGVN
jgi:hypothetical protein